MYILKNAWISITRNKGRNILIGIIILVISCACSITLAINNSATKLINAYEDKYDVIVGLNFDRRSMMQEFDPESNDRESMIDKFNDISKFTISDIEKFGDSKYVKSYYYTNSIGLNADDLEKASSEINDDENSNRKMPGGMDGTRISSSDFKLVGYSSYDAMNEFINGSYSITSGEISSDFEGNNCAINSELATLNELTVGDSITLVNPNDSDYSYELIITGIFEELEDESVGFSLFSNSANNIITNSNVVNKIMDDDEDIETTLTPSFILTSSDDLDLFQEELYDLGLDENYTITSNLDQVDSATNAISNVKSFANTFLIITLIIGGVVLFVINMINVKERKYEIGVLRTIGMNKLSLTTQFLIELTIVSLMSLLVGAGIGSTLSVSISNSLLENEIVSSQEELNEMNSNFGKMPGSDDARTKMPNMNSNHGVANIEAYDSIDAVVNMEVLGQLLLIGIILTMMSSLASMISIQKFSPLTILKERS